MLKPDDSKNKLTLERIEKEISEFKKGFKSVVMATLTKDGLPFASYAPLAQTEEGNFIYISEISDHYGNLVANNVLDVLFVADEDNSPSISFRRRVRYKSVATLIEKDEYGEKILDMLEKKDRMVAMTRKMTDFHLFKIDFKEGRYVNGPGRAYDIDENGNVHNVKLDKEHTDKFFGPHGHPHAKS